MAIVDNRTPVWVADGDNVNNLIATIDKRARVVFPKLVDTSYSELRARSQKWASNAAVFLEKRDFFVISRLSKFAVIKIDMGYSTKAPIDLFTQTIASMSDGSAFGNPKVDLIDVSSSATDSELLTAALVWQLHQRSMEGRRSDDLSYNNLLTTALYDPKYKFYDWDEVKPKVEHLWEECVSINGSSAEINYLGLSSFLTQSKLLHWQPPEIVIAGGEWSASQGANENKVIIVFKNDVRLWGNSDKYYGLR